MDSLTENKFYKVLLVSQIGMFLSLIISLIFIGIIEWFFPNFFNYPYIGSVKSLNSILNFWPLFLYGLIMASVSTIGVVSTELDEENFLLSSITSVLAGIWEELGFRWLYICGAMIGLAFSNWLLGTFVSWIMGALMIVLGFVLLFVGKINGKTVVNFIKILSGALSCFVVGIGIFYISSRIDPLYWVYSNVFIPVIDFVTIKQFHSIFYNSAYPPLFLFALILVNAKFRDGHKYQGPLGMLNAWIIGFIMMFAMLNYGLVLAIALHIIYDLEFCIVRYSGRKIWGRKHSMYWLYFKLGELEVRK